ncbi:MAG: type II secretion system protein H [Marinobacter excellens HL-55]|uniref:Type II secretion system protein H n=1 Tax=Marinobacter excellens HL-55 TaxID=1305731 RepID=A0A0P7YIK5_9GAMM|nr:MAG: type II secretion system protein H [Marinobacter excellens HL-55]
MKPRANQSGFTLIEILVVLIIVGLLAALAVFNMAGSSQQRELENTVQDLYLLMQTASEQAVLNNSELGLLLDEDSYRFVAFQDDTGEWEMSGERLFRSRPLPEWLVLTDYIENDAPRLTSSEDQLRPDVVFFSSGETTPFILEFTLGRDTDNMHTLESDGLEPMQWRKPGGEGET